MAKESKLQLEVGKRFLNRQGQVVEILEKMALTTHPYLGSDDELYRPNGRVHFFKESDIDLIEETEENSPRRPGSWDALFSELFNKKAA